jgi:hypothetical protein
MWVSGRKLTNINFDIKTRPYNGADKWQHQHITQLPEFDILYKGEESSIPSENLNWAKNDYRHSKSIVKWFNGYWDQTELVQKYTYFRSGKGENRKVTGRYLNPKYKTKQELYEHALELEIQNAIKRLNKKWAKKIVKDYEQEHQDPLVKFVNKESA